MVDIKIRSAKENDSKDIFEWRNDELTRQMSHTSEIIEWENHSRWYSNSLDSESRILLICEDDRKEKIAIIRFDISESNAVISINLNPTQRSKGLAKSCLIESIEFFSKEYIEIKNLIAEIKEENIASQKTFLGIGFTKYTLKDNVGFYEKKLVWYKNIMSLKFEKIIPTQNQNDELFSLLNNRKYSISHTSTPSKNEHSEFVSAHPYRVWYLVYKNKSLIGSVYLHVDNSVGIDLIEYYESEIFSVIKYIKDNHKPLPSIKSVRRDNFFINVASENEHLIKILKKLDKSEIQRSFLI